MPFGIFGTDGLCVECRRSDALSHGHPSACPQNSIDSLPSNNRSWISLGDCGGGLYLSAALATLKTFRDDRTAGKIGRTNYKGQNARIVEHRVEFVLCISDKENSTRTKTRAFVQYRTERRILFWQPHLYFITNCTVPVEGSSLATLHLSVSSK